MRAWVAGLVVAAVAVVSVAASQPAPAAAGGRSLLAEYEDGRWYVPVTAKVAGKKADLGWFILDTGVDGVVLDDAVAKRLRLRVKPRGTQGGAGSGVSKIGTAHAPALGVGPVTIAAADVNVLPLDAQLAPSSGRHVGGIIGSALFQAHAVLIDRGRGSIVIDPPGVATGADLPEAGRQHVKFTLQDGIPVVAATLAVPGSDSVRSLRLIVDLGAKAPLLLTEPFLARIGGEAHIGPHVLASLGAGVGGETRYNWARTGALQLVGETAPLADSLVAGYSALGTLKSAFFDGLLGAPLLDCYAVLFDYASSTLWLSPRPERGLPPEPLMGFDASGMFLLQDGERVIVHRVVEGSPAALAGIAEGDELISIGGYLVKGVRLSELRRSLRQVGTYMTIGYRHAGVGNEVMVTLRRLF
jgi:hypothetical protein